MRKIIFLILQMSRRFFATLFLLIAFIVLGCSESTLTANAQIISNSEVSKAIIPRAVIQQTMRVTEPLELITLPLINGGEWNIKDNLRRCETVLVFMGVTSAEADITQVISLLPKSQGDEHKMECILVASATAINSLKSKPLGIRLVEADAPNAKRMREKLVGGNSTALVVAVVDQAGFLRSLEVIPTMRQASEVLIAALKRLNQTSTKVEVNSLAPDWSLPGVSLAQPDEFSLRLSDYRGRKNVLLTFFPRCFTGNCTFHLSSLRDRWLELEAKDVQVIAVSVDPAQGKEGQLAYIRHHNFPFPFVPDTDRNLSLLFGAVDSPTQIASRMSLFIDKQGIIRWIDKQVDVKTHGDDVLNRIRLSEQSQ